MSAPLTLATSTKPARLTKRWELVSGTPTKKHAGEMAEGFAHKTDAPTRRVKSRCPVTNGWPCCLKPPRL